MMCVYLCVHVHAEGTAFCSPGPDSGSLDLDQHAERFAITRTTKKELPSISLSCNRQNTTKHSRRKRDRKRDRKDREEGKGGSMMEEESKGKPG